MIAAVARCLARLAVAVALLVATVLIALTLAIAAALGLSPPWIIQAHRR
jgi:hypothetical protein